MVDGYFLEILTDFYKAYSAENNEKWQSIVKFDCRGLEPIDFDPRVRIVYGKHNVS